MDLVIRTAVMYFVVFGMTRVLGRRELSSLEPFDLILLIVLGDAIQQGLTQDDYSVTGALIVIFTFGTLVVVVSWLNFRFPSLRPLLDGNPLILLEDGKPIERNLRRERLSVKELEEEARKQSIASLDEIRWAVLETSGEMTFIKKDSS
jgi:uncharacterized membrane protein YcaP (DUF421 family)